MGTKKCPHKVKDFVYRHLPHNLGFTSNTHTTQGRVLPSHFLQRLDEAPLAFGEHVNETG